MGIYDRDYMRNRNRPEADSNSPHATIQDEFAGRIHSNSNARSLLHAVLVVPGKVILYIILITIIFKIGTEARWLGGLTLLIMVGLLIKKLRKKITPSYWLMGMILVNGIAILIGPSEYKSAHVESNPSPSKIAQMSSEKGGQENSMKQVVDPQIALEDNRLQSSTTSTTLWSNISAPLAQNSDENATIFPSAEPPPGCFDLFPKIPNSEGIFQRSPILTVRRIQSWSDSTCGIAPSNGTPKIQCEMKTDNGVTLFYWFNHDGSGGMNKCGRELTLAEMEKNQRDRESAIEKRRVEARSGSLTLDCSDPLYQAKTYFHLYDALVSLSDSPKFPPTPKDCPNCWTGTKQLSEGVVYFVLDTYLGEVELSIKDNYMVYKIRGENKVSRRTCKQVSSR
jgi:hypothetical protein